MKNYYYKFTLFFSFILFLFSCKEKSSHSYYSIIPENTSFLLAFTPEEILKKAEVKDKWINYMQNSNSNNENANKKIEELLRNGKESGIDIDEKFYAFALDNNYNAFGLVAKVDNINKLTETFKTVQDYNNGYGEVPVKNGNYYQLAFDNDVVCVYDAHKILFLTTRGSKESAFSEALQLIQRDTVGSIIHTSGFKEVQKKNEDFIALIQMNKMPNMQLSMMGISASEIKNTDLLFTLDFQKGKINLSYKFVGDEKLIKDLKEEQRKIFGKVKNEFLDFFPENTLAYMTGNINGEEFYKYLGEQGVLESIPTKEKNNIETIIRNINGDISVGITSVSAFGTPSFLLYGDVKGVEAVNAFSKIDFGPMGTMNNLGNNRYEYKMRYLPLNIYFGMVNNKLYATNDDAMYSSLGQKPNNAFTSTKFTRNWKDIDFGMVINAAEILNLPAVGASLQMMGLNMPYYRIFLSEVSYIEMLMYIDSIETSLNVYLNNDNENSLKLIADKLYSF